MADPVVDRLEVVEVEDDQREVAARTGARAPPRARASRGSSGGCAAPSARRGRPAGAPRGSAARSRSRAARAGELLELRRARARRSVVSGAREDGELAECLPLGVERHGKAGVDQAGVLLEVPPRSGTRSRSRGRPARPGGPRRVPSRSASSFESPSVATSASRSPPRRRSGAMRRRRRSCRPRRARARSRRRGRSCRRARRAPASAASPRRVRSSTRARSRASRRSARRAPDRRLDALVRHVRRTAHDEQVASTARDRPGRSRSRSAQVSLKAEPLHGRRRTPCGTLDGFGIGTMPRISDGATSHQGDVVTQPV